MEMKNIILNVFKSVLYPPTEDQLLIIRYFFNNIWILRIFSLIILLVDLFFWYKTIVKLTGKAISLISCLIIFLTPTFYILWLTCPFDCLKIFLLTFLVYFLSKNKKHFGKLVLILGSIYLILFSFLTTKERSSLIYKLGLKDARTEVQNRFTAEDSLTNPVEVPLKIKKIVYNKYYFEYKELINEIIPFFDIESLFFQEIHPLEQKSIVIFVWPEIFLLISGIYFLIKLKNKKIKLLVLVTLLLSFVNFLFNPFSVFRKFEIILFPLSLIMALAVLKVYKTKIIFGKVVGLIIIFFCLYGIMTNHFDLNKRPDYWLDNRPYFYEFVFNSIKNRDFNNFQKIFVTSLVGNSENYCKYYLESCDKNKFIFNSFDLKENRPEKNVIYAGFVGEFVGSDFYNNINSEWLTLVNSKGFAKIEIKNLRDTIAYKFGNTVVIGEVK